MMAHEREKKLKKLLARTDLLILLMMKCTDMFHAINDVIHVLTLWLQKVVLIASLRKVFTKLDGLPHVFPKM